MESELGTGLLEAEWKNSATNYLSYISWFKGRKRPVVTKYLLSKYLNFFFPCRTLAIIRIITLSMDSLYFFFFCLFPLSLLKQCFLQPGLASNFL